MSTDLLHVKRTHADGRHYLLGYELQIPPMELPDKPVPKDHPEEKLGWKFHKRAGTSFGGIQPEGLCAPSTWERRYLEWLSAESRAPLMPGWDSPGATVDPLAHQELRDALARARPWSSSAPPPLSVTVSVPTSTSSPRFCISRMMWRPTRGWTPWRQER